MLTAEESQNIREQFPFYRNPKQAMQTIYFDNAATTQKANRVLQCLTELWSNGSANVHRSSHTLANRLTQRFENARNICAAFINARDASEIVWTSGATESINLVAQSWGRNNIAKGDQILVTEMEHHANLLPWQRLCEETGAKMVMVPTLESSELDLQSLDSLLNPAVKLLAITHVSNVMGTINPIQEIVSKCRKYNCKVLVDGAQAIAHLPVDVQQLDCDFYAFSGHKCFAGEGSGVLFGKKELLGSMPPWKMGGEMVRSVEFDSAKFQPPPLRFEAGTPNISGIIAFAEALQFLDNLDRKKLHQHEQDLTAFAEKKLQQIEGISIHSNAANKTSIIAFSFKGCQAMDIASLLDEQNIAIRSGQLCAMPLVKKYNHNGILRVSFSFYNTSDEVLAFIEALQQSIEILRP